MVRLAGTVLAFALFGLANPAASVQTGAPVGRSQEDFVYISLLPSADRAQLVIVDGTSNDEAGNPRTRSVNHRDVLIGKDLATNNVKFRAVM